jgi:hypothetical protein
VKPSVSAGKVADMVVLAEDPLTCELDRLKDIRIERTFLGGRQVRSGLMHGLPAQVEFRRSNFELCRAVMRC